MLFRQRQLAPTLRRQAAAYGSRIGARVARLSGTTKLVRGRRDRAQGIQDQTPALKNMPKTQAKQLVVCVDNDGYAASLEKRKIYVALRDAAAEKHAMLR